MTSIGLEQYNNKAFPLIAAPQVVTGSWADVGIPVTTGDYDLVAFWMKLTINDGLGIQVRILGSDVVDFTDSYVVPIQDISDPDKIGLAPQVFELTDETQNLIIPMAISDSIPFIKFQIKATTPGATPASLVMAKISAKTTGRE